MCGTPLCLIEAHEPLDDAQSWPNARLGESVKEQGAKGAIKSNRPSTSGHWQCAIVYLAMVTIPHSLAVKYVCARVGSDSRLD